jgi:hypothetical protein
MVQLEMEPEAVEMVPVWLEAMEVGWTQLSSPTGSMFVCVGFNKTATAG